jgi:methylmalonyl-CoA carboxyltransferase large subunit
MEHAMAADPTDLARLAESLDALRREVARLGERVAALESRATPAGVPVPSEELSEELLVVLGAAIAAYLGKKAPIRQVRLLSTAAWAQQGRLTIQASHALQS